MHAITLFAYVHVLSFLSNLLLCYLFKCALHCILILGIRRSETETAQFLSQDAQCVSLKRLSQPIESLPGMHNSAYQSRSNAQVRILYSKN